MKNPTKVTAFHDVSPSGIYPVAAMENLNYSSQFQYLWRGVHTGDCSVKNPHSLALEISLFRNFFCFSGLHAGVVDGHDDNQCHSPDEE